MDYLPVFLDIKGRRCLVIGGGDVAARKIRLLLRAGASVEVCASELKPTVQTWADTGRLSHAAKVYEPSLLNNAALVIAATNDAALNARVSKDAKARDLPVNVVDQPALCSFVTPSIIDRSPIVIALSSGGRAPVLARLLRARLEATIPSAYGRLAELAGQYRSKVKTVIPNARQRLRFWESVFDGPIGERALAGQPEKAQAALEAALANAAEQSSNTTRGEVYLVGGGPGDPDLLTFRALRLMQQCDVVLYDRLVAPALTELVRRDADQVYVGKQRDRHALPQEEINALMIQLAKAGKRVLRLKGGDPFIFGRGGEEIADLAAAGIDFQVVPGITAASGCAAYAGIPLTHRDHAQSVRFVTGHLKDDKLDLDWQSLVAPGQTLVFYMGLKTLPNICEALVKNGLSASTPVAVIDEGTTPRQQVITGTLDTIAQLVTAAEISGPSLTVVGDVVQLHETLAWFKPEGRNAESA